MKTLLTCFALVLLAFALPREASAQCNDACTRLVRDGQLNGYGCVYMEGSGMNCIATSTRCNLQRCMYAYLTTPEGRLVEMRNGCDESAVATRVTTTFRKVGDRLAALLDRQVKAIAADARRSGTGVT